MPAPVCKSLTRRLDLDARVPNEKDHVYGNIQQENSNIGVSKTLTCLWLRNVVAEVHLSVGKDHDCALVQNLNPVSEGRLHRLENKQIN